MVTAVVAVTALLVTVTFAEVDPAGMTTETGIVAAVVLLLVNVTVAPPLGAKSERFTVTIALAEPPITVAGDIVRVDNAAGGLTFRTSDFDNPLAVAVMVAPTTAVTALVWTVMAVEVDPAGTTRDAGTIAAALFDARVTVRPPVGAALESVTVAVADAPPKTDVGVKAMPVIAGGLTVIPNALVSSPVETLTEAVVALAMDLAVSVTVPVTLPPGMTMDVGPSTMSTDSAKGSISPPAGAALSTTAVKVVDSPASNVVFVAVSELMFRGATSFSESVASAKPFATAVIVPVESVV